MRDPFARLPSHYQYLKRCDAPGHPLADHPLVSAIRSEKMTFDDFIRWDCMENLFSRLLHPLQISDFHFVSIQEFYDLSMQLLAKKLKLQLPEIRKANVNPKVIGYPLTLDQAKAIAKIHRDDLTMYRDALCMFHEELRRFP